MFLASDACYVFFVVFLFRLQTFVHRRLTHIKNVKDYRKHTGVFLSTSAIELLFLGILMKYLLFYFTRGEKK